MARYYMALGPFDSRETAERARAGMTESDALRACVLRLRDRTGPSVAARLAKLEEHARRFDLNEHHARLAAVQDALAHLETEHTALVERVGELERLPVASEGGDDTARMLAALRGLGDGDARKGFAAMMGEPAPARPEPGSVADPDRLAKVATDPFAHLHTLTEDLHAKTLFAPQELRGVHIRAALSDAYNLGREHGRAGRDALSAPPNPTGWFVDLGDDPATTEVIRAEGEDTFLVCRRYRDGDVKHYHWSRNTIAAGSRRMTPSEVAAVANATRPSAPTPIARVPVESAGADGARLQSEHRMCSDLAADGMSPCYAADGSRRWLRRDFATPSDIESAPTTAVAHAAMRAAKGAK